MFIGSKLEIVTSITNSFIVNLCEIFDLTNTYFKLNAYIVSFELEAPCGRTRNKYVPTFRFSNFAEAVSLDIGPTNQ